MGLELTEINSFAHPIPAEQAQAMITQLRGTIEAEGKVQQEITQLQQTKEKKIYSDPRLAGAKEVVERIFVRTPEIIKDL